MNIFLEMSQGNSLGRYLKQTKMSGFISFTKSKNRRAKQVLSGGIGTSVWEEEVGKG
jgi:predicted acetyltransferase